MASPFVFSDISSVENELAAIEKQIAARKSQLASASKQSQAELDGVQKNLRSAEKRLVRHETKVERAEERLTFVNGNIKELDTWYEDLSAIEKGLNGSTYETKKATLSADRRAAKEELKSLESEKLEMEKSIQESQVQEAKLAASIKSSTSSINSDSQIKSFLNKQKQKQAELASLLKAASQQAKIVSQKAEIAAAKSKAPAFKTYVYVVSGKKGGSLEKTLKLKKWVESYQAKYIEANWNDLTAQSSVASGSMINFLSQMEQDLSSIPKASKVIIIGYGLGGGAAILAATEVAAKINRQVDYLITIDPMGIGDSRMNAVYLTEAYCQGRISPEQYASCLSKAEKRLITPNVKNFYNRWQRESSLPIDAKDRMTVNKQEYVLATGKFKLASQETEANQKRVYYGDKSAHELILSDAAAELPKILVPLLR
jgi:hypothetical protein